MQSGPRWTLRPAAFRHTLAAIFPGSAAATARSAPHAVRQPHRAGEARPAPACCHRPAADHRAEDRGTAPRATRSGRRPSTASAPHRRCESPTGGRSLLHTALRCGCAPPPAAACGRGQRYRRSPAATRARCRSAGCARPRYGSCSTNSCCAGACAARIARSFPRRFPTRWPCASGQRPAQAAARETAPPASAVRTDAAHRTAGLCAHSSARFYASRFNNVNS